MIVDAQLRAEIAIQHQVAPGEVRAGVRLKRGIISAWVSNSTDKHLLRRCDFKSGGFGHEGVCGAQKDNRRGMEAADGQGFNRRLLLAREENVRQLLSAEGSSPARHPTRKEHGSVGRVPGEYRAGT